MTRTASSRPINSHVRQPNARPSTVQSRQRKLAKRTKKSWLSTWLVICVALIIVSVSLVAVSVFIFDPATSLRNELIRQVKASTGRDLTTAGKPSLTFYPNVGVVLPKIAISPPPGMQGTPTIRADRLYVAVSLLPLLTSRIVINQVNLERPIIDLRIDNEGRKSWQITRLAQPIQLAKLPTSLSEVASDVAKTVPLKTTALFAAQPSNNLDILENLELRALSINNGYVQYRDDRNEINEGLANIDLKIKGQRLNKPIVLDGALDWNNERLNIKMHLKTISNILNGRAATAYLDIQGPSINASFNGTVTAGVRSKAIGPISFSTPSLQQFMRWTGIDLPNGAQLGALALSGDLTATPAEAVLNKAKFSLGQTKLSGNIAVEFTHPRPKVKSSLTVSQLDIDKLSASFKEVRALPRSRPQLIQEPTQSQSPKSINDILRGTQSGKDNGAGRFSPQVRGFKKTIGWSRDPIDVALMRFFDADAKLKIFGLRVRGLSINETVLRFTLTNAIARADLDDMQLYGGRGRGILTAQANTSDLKWGMNVALSDVSTQPLLKDTADLNLISGNARVTVALGSHGGSEHEFMSNLAGKANFNFTDGAIFGWNIPQMLRGLQTGRIANFNQIPNAKTDFSQLSASFTINRGIANTQDLQMLSPLLRMTGSGNTDVGRRQLDMILRPKLVASLSGQEGQANLGGIEVPVRINGTWDKPNIQPDINGIISDPKLLQKTIDTVEQLKKQFKGKKARDIIRGLLGNN